MTQIITKRQPLLSNLAQLQETINQLLDPNLIEQEGFSKTLTTDWVPSIDVKDASSHYLVTADIPGVDPKNIDVSLEGNVLVITGQKETKKKEENKNYMRVERTKGAFYRSVAFPDAVLTAKIVAKSRHGVLEIVVPKDKNGKKRIKVKK